MAMATLLLLFSISVYSMHATGSFHVDLIHRDSPKSPIYNPSLSSSDRFLAAARRSRDRANYFHRSLSASAASNNSKAFHSDVIPDSYEYLMTINIGSPAMKVHAIVDTGSDLIWTQCQPCTDCYSQTDPIFDPSKSSTYNTISCNSDTCSALPESGCGLGSDCQYLYSYGDQSTTSGVLSTETLTFDSDGKRKAVVPNVFFGCSYDSEGTFDAGGGGLVGLGGGSLSLTSQLGPTTDNKFSYCLVPYSDQTATSLLSFGSSSRNGFSGQATPLAQGKSDTDDTDTFYYLTLESIGIGNKTVSTSSSKGNIIIDSGTTLTLIDDSLLQPLVDGLKEAVNLPIAFDPNGIFELCFDGSKESEFSLDKLPSLQFGFTGASITLLPINSFVEIEEMICLAITSSASLGFSIFGNIAQQNFLIGYDLKAREVYIEPKDCTKPYVSNATGKILDVRFWVWNILFFVSFFLSFVS